MRSVCECWHFCIFEIICELRYPLWEIAQSVSRCLTHVPIFICFLVSVRFRDRFPDARVLVSPLRIVAGLDEISLNASCSNDVEDVLALELEEPVDNPRTTIGRKFSLLHWILLIFLIRVLRRAFQVTKLQACPRGFVPSRRAPSVKVYCCFLMCLHFSIGCNHRCGVPGLSKDAPESTTNSRSSGFFEEGAGISHASV